VQPESLATTESHAASSAPIAERPSSNGFAALRQKRDARPAHVAKAPTTTPTPASELLDAQPSPTASSSTLVSQATASKAVTPPSPADELARDVKPPTDPTSTAPGTGLLLLRALSPLSPADGWAILRQYPPSNIPLILGAVLEPDTLAILIRVLQHGHTSDATTVHSIMTGLQKAPRIRMNAAMLDEPDRAIATKLWSSHSTTNWP
jgi:hypothetical protein